MTEQQIIEDRIRAVGDRLRPAFDALLAELPGDKHSAMAIINVLCGQAAATLCAYMAVRGHGDAGLFGPENGPRLATDLGRQMVRFLIEETRAIAARES